MWTVALTVCSSMTVGMYATVLCAGISDPKNIVSSTNSTLAKNMRKNSQKSTSDRGKK